MVKLGWTISDTKAEEPASGSPVSLLSDGTTSNDNLSLMFDDENAEIVKQEEGLIALCVGRLTMEGLHTQCSNVRIFFLNICASVIIITL